MALKQAKVSQTDYTKGGRDISNTAIPLYQENLGRMNAYLEDPTQTIDKYLNKYYTNTASQNDFLRNYQNAMSGLTGQNYAATTGGYASKNQMNYADQQRYYNDLAARLREQGVSGAYNMAQGGFNNMLNANNSYLNAYNLGKAYSDVQQYNDLVDQQNSFGNILGNVLGTVGDIGMATGWAPAMAIDGALKTGGSMVGTDTSDAMAYLRGYQPTTANVEGAYGNMNQGLTGITGALQTLFKGKGNTSNTNMTPRQTYAGNTSLGNYDFGNFLGLI